jgi:hypothetical protein
MAAWKLSCYTGHNPRIVAEILSPCHTRAEFVLQVSYLKCVLLVAVFSNIMMAGTDRELYYNTEINENF